MRLFMIEYVFYPILLNHKRLSSFEIKGIESKFDFILDLKFIVLFQEILFHPHQTPFQKYVSIQQLLPFT